MRDFWVGCYAPAGMPSLRRLRWSPGARTLTSVVDNAALTNPSFLAARADGRFLYAVSEVETGEGAVAAFAVEDEGLRLINTVPSGGRIPCHVTVTPDERALLVTNYGTGSVGVFPLDAGGPVKGLWSLTQLSGSGPMAVRQEAAHTHQTLFASPTLALVCDLGADRLFRFNWSGQRMALSLATPPSLNSLPGAGPRHACVHPTLGAILVANELDSTLSVFDASGRMTQNVATTRTDNHGTNYPAHIALTPDGGFVLVSNRGDDTIAVFRIDPASGVIKRVGYAAAGGAWPRHFAILDADGRGGQPWHVVAACQRGNCVTVLPLDAATGMPGPAVARLDVPAPGCILPIP